MALIEGEPVSIGSSPVDLAVNLARRLARPESELITLVVGRDAATDHAAVEQALRRSFAELDLHVVEGGQPRYPFLIGVE